MCEWSCEYGNGSIMVMGMNDVMENINYVKWCNVLGHKSNVSIKYFLLTKL